MDKPITQLAMVEPVADMTISKRPDVMTVAAALPDWLSSGNLLFPGNPPRFQSLRHEENAAKMAEPVRQAILTLCHALEPARPTQIATELEFLRARYHAFETDQNDLVADELEQEWLDDLGQYPLSAIREARRLWRNSPAEFAPRSAGQLMAPVKPRLRRLRAMLRRAQMAQAAIEAVERRTR